MLTAPRLRVVGGVVEACGPRVAAWLDLISPRRRIDAMTLGHVVLGRTRAALATTRRHERVHVTQCERWGPFFLPAYLASSVWAWIQGGDAYIDNAFERSAWRVAPCGRPGESLRAGVNTPAPGAGAT